MFYCLWQEPSQENLLDWTKYHRASYHKCFRLPFYIPIKLLMYMPGNGQKNLIPIPYPHNFYTLLTVSHLTLNLTSQIKLKRLLTQGRPAGHFPLAEI